MISCSPADLLALSVTIEETQSRHRQQPIQMQLVSVPGSWH